MTNTPIIIVGMARSGTTIVSHLLGSTKGVHSEVEPHALWKSGNFIFFNDEEYNITDEIVERIRLKFTANLGEKTLIEKSPINCLRPYLVHAVFPDAKVVYVERDSVRCIHSNYKRSMQRDSFKLSIILKKYFWYTGSKDLSGAISERKLFQQISILDLPRFTLYTLKMFYVRQVENLLPFGPKLKNFRKIVKEEGLLKYHVKVFKTAEKYKTDYIKLYKERISFFRMEDLMNSKAEIKRLLNFTSLDYTDEIIDNLYNSFDSERVIKSSKTDPIDDQILELINHVL